MKINFFILLITVLVPLSFSSCKQEQKKEPVELMEVTGIVSGYNKDLMYLTVLRTGMTHPLRVTEHTKMDIFAAPKDTVLLVYTGYLGYTVVYPEIREVHTRPYIETGSKIVNLKELKESGSELITRP